MSMVDAIEKAKRLAIERQHKSAPEHQTGQGKDFEPQRATTGMPSRRASDIVQSAPDVRLEPLRVDTVLPYDVKTCSAFHIMVPGGDPLLARAAAAPYRMMRALVLRRAASNGWSCLGLTSPGPGEGKSTTAINLALSLAREGNYDVFLIDLDMRSPRIASYLGVEPRVELVQYFEGGAEAADVLFSIGIDRLIVAGAKQISDHSSELLSNGRLEELLGFIRQKSSRPFIILDLPPVGVTDDALVVAPKIDSTVLVASQGITRREALRGAIDLLSEHSLAGVILNRSEDPLGTDYYGDYRN